MDDKFLQNIVIDESGCWVCICESEIIDIAKYALEEKP